MIREKKPTLIIAFDETTQAMATDKFCTRHALPGRLIPVPREITAGCGLAWKAAPEEKETLLSALKEAGIEWSATYILEL